jgi:hypothetical protein
MRPLFVVFVKPGFGDLVISRTCSSESEHVGAEHFLAIGRVEPFDDLVLVGLTRLDEAQFDPMALASFGEGDGDQLPAIV